MDLLPDTGVPQNLLREVAALLDVKVAMNARAVRLVETCLVTVYEFVRVYTRGRGFVQGYVFEKDATIPPVLPADGTVPDGAYLAMVPTKPLQTVIIGATARMVSGINPYPDGPEGDQEQQPFGAFPGGPRLIGEPRFTMTEMLVLNSFRERAK